MISLTLKLCIIYNKFFYPLNRFMFSFFCEYNFLWMLHKMEDYNVVGKQESIRSYKGIYTLMFIP